MYLLKISKCNKLHGFLFIVLTFFPSCAQENGFTDQSIGRLQGDMTGEVTPTSAILQTRLTATMKDETGDIPGRSGVARFEITEDSLFSQSWYTDWMKAAPASDYIVKSVVQRLEPDTRYYYRVEWGENESHTQLGKVSTFRTLAGADIERATRFVVVTGMHYGRFRETERGKEADAHLGYPALVSILDRTPDFFVGTGDNVYYDHMPLVTSLSGMRKKWHEQFAQNRYHDLFASVPTYWEKDDHDLRYDDCDSTDTPKRPDSVLPLPTFEDGLKIFREQLPIVDPQDENSVTYRTHRVSKLLQIWLLEGRDYRSPNLMPDGPDKTMWGVEQREWLKQTLLSSDATFKVIISPTPMIGPDDLRKKDNHTNIGGFKYEGSAFFQWAYDQEFLNKGLYVVCGDRHWQYHSRHPLGFEEFSSGALVDGNARLGVVPGDPNSTDPDQTIEQLFTSPEPSGGFLEVQVEPANGEEKATIGFHYYDENGEELYAVTRISQ